MPAEHPLLRRGAQGDDVRRLQDRLVAHGYTLRVDGDFGPLTEGAVRTWQHFLRLSPDGIVGPATWARLVADYTTAYSARLSRATHRWLAAAGQAGVAPIHALVGSRTHEQQARIMYGRIQEGNPDLAHYPARYLALMRAAYPRLDAMLAASVADGAPVGSHLADEAVDLRVVGLLDIQREALVALLRSWGQGVLHELHPEHLHIGHLERWAGWTV